MQSALKIGLTILLICFLCTKTYSSMNKTQAYVSRSDLKNSLHQGYSGLLFAQYVQDSVKAEYSDTTRLRDPKMAVFYAIVPGVLVHGAGHFYAGKYTTGLILVGSEVIGGSLLFIGGLSGLEKTSPTVTGGLLILAGGLLFAGSWAYDLIAAPAAVEKENEKLLKKKSVALKFEFDHRYDCIKIALIQEF